MVFELLSIPSGKVRRVYYMQVSMESHHVVIPITYKYSELASYEIEITSKSQKIETKSLTITAKEDKLNQEITITPKLSLLGSGSVAAQLKATDIKGAETLIFTVTKHKTLAPSILWLLIIPFLLDMIASEQSTELVLTKSTNITIPEYTEAEETDP